VVKNTFEDVDFFDENDIEQIVGLLIHDKKNE
jgi:hypothetical protein